MLQTINTVSVGVMPKSSYLALDPGHTIGWASFDAKGDVIDMGQFHMDNIVQELDKLIHSELLAIITEDYKNHGFSQQKKWSRNETSKVIGKIEIFAELKNVPVILQSNTKKTMGYMYAGCEPPSNHSISHQYDAYAHGVFWLQTHSIRPIGKALMEQEKKND